MSENFTITLQSFGFKHGPAPEANIVMDVRFLQNPHWVDELKDKTGLDPEIGAYIKKDPEFGPFIENFKALLKPLLPLHRENMDGFTIALGCTGGRHRSVFTVQELNAWLGDEGYNTRIIHRDLEK